MQENLYFQRNPGGPRQPSIASGAQGTPIELTFQNLSIGWPKPVRTSLRLLTRAARKCGRVFAGSYRAATTRERRFNTTPN